MRFATFDSAQDDKFEGKIKGKIVEVDYEIPPKVGMTRKWMRFVLDPYRMTSLRVRLRVRL
jgi:hypothetical protein